MLYICKREDEATSTASARSALVNSWRITSEHRVNIVHSSNKPQTFTLRSTTFLNPKNSKTMGTVKGRHSRLSSTTLRGYMMAKQMALLVDDSTVACICVVHHETIKKSPSPPVKAVEREGNVIHRENPISCFQEPLPSLPTIYELVLSHLQGLSVKRENLPNL